VKQALLAWFLACLPAWLVAWLPGVARALDFRAVPEAAVPYEAPALRAKPLFVIAADTPVEAVLTLNT